MKSKLYIGLSGNIGSGKTTAAKILSKLLKIDQTDNWKVVAFSDALKKVASALTQVSPYIFETAEGKNTTIKNLKYQGENITCRQFLQIFATDIMRKNFGDNFWVDHLFNEYDKEDPFDNPTNLIIHDVRFKNEADSIKSRGGILIRINRDNPEGYKMGSFNLSPTLLGMKAPLSFGTENKELSNNYESSVKSHISENDLNGYKFDYTYDNDGSIEDLEKFLIEVLKSERLYK